MSKLRIVVADDEVLVRQGLCGLLSLESDMEIVGEASNGAEVIDVVNRLHPDVVLMDIQMPVMNGVEATKALTAAHSNTRVLMLTTFDDDVLVVQAVQNGAHGYLLKDSGVKQLAAAIRTISLGYMTLGSQVSEKLLQNTTAAVRTDSPKLTPRELEVLHLLSEGKTNREIADQLSITEKTVRDHVCNILEELQLRDRTQAALWAKERGF